MKSCNYHFRTATLNGRSWQPWCTTRTCWASKGLAGWRSSCPEWTPKAGESTSGRRQSTTDSSRDTSQKIWWASPSFSFSLRYFWVSPIFSVKISWIAIYQYHRISYIYVNSLIKNILCLGLYILNCVSQKESFDPHENQFQLLFEFNPTAKLCQTNDLFFWWSEKKFYFVLKLVQYHPCQEFFCSTTFTKFLPPFENIDWTLFKFFNLGEISWQFS